MRAVFIKNTFSLFKSSRVCKNPAAIITGIDNNKENRAATILPNPRYLAIVIVTPLLDVPGIMASICASPIKKASFNPIWFKPSLF